MTKCFVCEQEKETREHWSGQLCDICHKLESNSSKQPAKSKWLEQHGCVCLTPLMDHGMSNNCPACGCWAGFNPDIGMKCKCNVEKWKR